MAGTAWLPVARKVVETKSATHIDDVLLDHYSADLMVKVHDHLNPENAQRFAEMPLLKAHEIAFKMANRAAAKAAAASN